MSGTKLRVLYPQYWGEFKVTSVVPDDQLDSWDKRARLSLGGGKESTTGVLSPDNCVIQGEAG